MTQVIDGRPPWVKDYLAGATLQEIATQEGITREGVRQRLVRLGIPVRSLGETRRMQQQKFVETHGARAASLFLEFRDVAQVAHVLDAPARAVQACVQGAIPDYAVLARAPRSVTKKYSNDELLEYLRTAATGLNVPMTGDVFEQKIASIWPADESRQYPSKQPYALRFGSWRAALEAAGLPANPTTQVPKKFDDPSVAVSAIVECWRELDSPPTVSDFDGWDPVSRGFPSTSLVRVLVGGSWNVGLVKAWQIVHGIRLDQEDQDAAVPEDLLPTVEYPEYVMADEAATVDGPPTTLDDYTKLERALQGHARMQNRLATLLAKLGASPVSPSSAPPMFDLGFALANSFVVVEVKSATEANLEMQLRIGVGQVLWYAHELRLRHAVVHPALAVELDPPERWRSLLDQLGIYLLTNDDLDVQARGLVEWAGIRDAGSGG